MTERVKGYLAASLTTLIIGFSFLFVKISLEYGNPLDILAHRFSVAFAAILPLAIVKRRELNLTWENFLQMLPIVVLYPVLFFSLQIFGLFYNVSSSEAGIIQATAPILIMILAVFFLKEKITIIQSIFTCLSVFGVLLIFFMKGSSIDKEHYFGLILVLLSVFSMSLYSILLRKNKAYFSVFQITFLCTVSGFIVFTIISLAQHVLQSDIETAYSAFFTIRYGFALLYLGVLSSLATSFFTSYAYAKIEASKLGVVGNLVIVVTIFAGVVFLDERLVWSQIVGAVLIFIGVLGTNIFSGKSQYTKN